MKEIAAALPWVAFWLFMAVAIWCDHRMYLAGHEGFFFTHKTPEEKRIQQALIAKLEREAKE